MNQDNFLQELAAEGFPGPVSVEKMPNEGIGPHRHAFEAKALIIEGEISLEVDGKKTVYRPGDVFHLAPNQLHAEQYGPQGVRYLAGRKS
jgi:hypothetical protein